MSVMLNNDGSLSITAMSLVEFLPEIEQAVHQGFMLDLEKNEGVPQQFGSMLVLTMFPCGLEVAGEEHEAALQESMKEDAPLAVIQEPQEAVAKVVEASVVEVKPADGRKKK